MSRKERKPLAKVTCTSTDCDEDLHCFRQAKKRGEEQVQGGRCRDCGADLVDFTRAHECTNGITRMLSTRGVR
jgi:hypothetical protein